MNEHLYTVTASPRWQQRWWVRTRPCKNAVQLGPQGVPAAIEFYVPFWAWPLELCHRMIFGRARLTASEGD